MASKQVTDRQKSARAVVAAAETHAADIAKGFERELSRYLHKGETFPDVALLARLVGRRLHADANALIDADQAHEQELSDDAGPRDARDTAASKIRSILVDVRAAVDATHGPDGLTLLGLGQAVPVDPSVLATTAEAISKALRDASIKLAKPKRAGMKIDRAAGSRARAGTSRSRLLWRPRSAGDMRSQPLQSLTRAETCDPSGYASRHACSWASDARCVRTCLRCTAPTSTLLRGPRATLDRGEAR